LGASRNGRLPAIRMTSAAGVSTKKNNSAMATELITFANLAPIFSHTF
jgi:hypothetical protein